MTRRSQRLFAVRRRDRSSSAPRSVEFRAEIGRIPRRDRFTSAPRSVHFRVEIGRVPHRDRFSHERARCDLTPRRGGALACCTDACGRGAAVRGLASRSAAVRTRVAPTRAGRWSVISCLDRAHPSSGSESQSSRVPHHIQALFREAHASRSPAVSSGRGPRPEPISSRK